MPYPPGHCEKTKAKIVRSARQLFNRFGFDRVSIDAIMADASLTRGAFYSYFRQQERPLC
jgi:AcrR family transcriptional regulator